MSADPVQGYILVVDDNEMNRDMLARRLERQQHKIDVAEDGEQALELMSKNRYDLVLLDIMMPKMNGYDVLERAKSDDTLKSTPIIMISAVDDLDSVVRCIEMGAEDYLFKPFNPVLLKARVGASLDKQRIRVQNQNGALPQQALYAARAILDDVRAIREGDGDALNSDQAQYLDHIQKQAQIIADMSDTQSGA